VPSTSIDTFFACTIIVAVALISTAFLTSTMQTSIKSTENINKDSYLQAIANHIITNPGDPIDWGTKSSVPIDFGLAVSSSTIPYELDINKITRLNSLNYYSLSYFDMANAAKLRNIAFGIAVSQVMSINIEQSSNMTVGNEVSFTFAVLTSIDSQPTNASLNCYVIANNYQTKISNCTSGIGVGYVSFQIPSASTNQAMLIVFARASFDDRITSYSIYNFQGSTQESAPRNTDLSITPFSNKLSFAINSTDLTIQSGYIFSYTYQKNLSPSDDNSQFLIPTLIDKSPYVLLVCGHDNNVYFQEWTSYPQVPLKSGSGFENSERNVFSYIVTINGVIYKTDVSFGDIAS
jgi:hypothetical protein